MDAIRIILENAATKVTGWEIAKEIIATIGGLATAVVAVLGIWLAYKTHMLSKQQSEESRKAAEQKMQAEKQQFEITQEAAKQQFEASRQESWNNRFTKAIEHLKDAEIPIRMAALYELQKLGLESSEEQGIIVRILSRYVRDRIEDSELRHPSRFNKKKTTPSTDAKLASEIISQMPGLKTYSFHLPHLIADNVDLSYFSFYRAYLFQAQLVGADLTKVDLDKADLQSSDLRDAGFKDASLELTDLRGANLLGALNLTATQLLEAIVDDTTLLDPALRAEYDRLKTEQTATPAS